MLKEFSPQSLFMGLLVAFVGFASSFAVILQGLKGVGASDLQAASGLMALSVSMGICGLIVCLKTRMPISIAWSTPGAALLVTAGVPQGGFSAAVGAFLGCAALIVIAGLFKPLGRAIGAIPAPLANAMLSGVIVGLCFAPFKAIEESPLLGLPILLAWAIVGTINRLFAVPAALAAFVLVLVFAVPLPDGAFSALGASLVPPVAFVMPTFTLASMVSIALPLFIVTMASQNIPGIAVLKVHDYHPRPGPLFTITGLFTALAAPFGAHAINLAAVTAAMAAGHDAHADPQRRYWAAMIGSVGYLVLGLLAGVVTSFVGLAPPILIESVAGLALIGAFSGSIVSAFREPTTREAAAVTFLVTASGISLLGISAAFWGLIGGLAMLGLTRFAVRLRR
ncbi:benzoate/H(+) symporter BenE family transporter [Agrobacterium vitis]|uniref:benzoate/H(+) symporter BenE family transporter n=1 Tax=Agrobacterium vitis TaxID=373 RepID=UPI0012E7ED3F|nr:benzoate/H(+) symporter BenE family transporter [Agrobacterium vitis]MVA72661.1 benzoate/H(+) symporter BenE family transporter [Agrobacterium vitis]